MNDLQWHFRAMSPSEIGLDPMEREFFVGEPISERLVREAIQNSLDAGLARRHNNRALGPVRVRFSLGGVHAPLGPESARRYLSGLGKHLIKGLDADDDFTRQLAQQALEGREVPYVVVEDSGTAGLEGDWLQYDDSEEQSARGNDFYWFFRNVGRSGKSDSDGGSWGLGKWVFPDSSHASAFIAITRRSDGEMLLMGQAVLKKHTLGGQRYAPYGYFGLQNDVELMTPLRISEPEHGPFIEQCINDFGLQFRKTQNPGLSLIIPFPRVEGDEPINKNQIAAAVVHNYFYPITAGRLEVTVDEGDESSSVHITTDTIADILPHLPLERSGERSMSSYQRLFVMCTDAATFPDNDYIELNSLPQNNPNYAHYDTLAGLRERFESGELLAFRIKTGVQKKDHAEEPTEFSLFVENDNSLNEGHDFYVRGELSISKMDRIKKFRARTLLIVDSQEPLAAMLRASEPPAHTMWRPQTDRVTKRWVSATRRIDDVRNSPERILAILESPPTEVQRDALADIFPSGVRGERRRPRGGQGTTGGGGRKVGPIESRLEPFRIERITGGFHVSFAENLAERPERAILQAAYEVPRGNALRKYNPHDFRLHGDTTVTMTYEGCTLTPGTDGNELLVNIDDADQFSVTVRGFDRHRDVLVKVSRAE